MVDNMQTTPFQFIATALVALLFAGCPKEQIQEVVQTGVEQTTQVVEETVETVKQEANLVGSMELTSDPPLATKACYVSFLNNGEDLPNKLELASYKSDDLERFPSIFFHAQVAESSLGDLAGKTVDGQITAQVEDGGTVWATPTGSSATISVTQVDEKSVTCEVASALLVNSDTLEEMTVSGKFVALVE